MKIRYLACWLVGAWIAGSLFMILVATGITKAEWEFAKRTTTVHLLLLLCRAGIAQRTIPERPCLMSNPHWLAEAALIEGISPEECEAEIESGIAH